MAKCKDEEDLRIPDADPESVAKSLFGGAPRPRGTKPKAVNPAQVPLCAKSCTKGKQAHMQHQKAKLT